MLPDGDNDLKALILLHSEAWLPSRLIVMRFEKEPGSSLGSVHLGERVLLSKCQGIISTLEKGEETYECETPRES